jgi:hypothetical protein
VAAVAIVATVALAQTAVWAAAVLLVLLMFSSYALRSWSPRIASLALMGAITVYVTGAGYITIGRIGWFVLALAVGFGWLAVWETLILPDNPVRSLHQSVRAFSRRPADTASGVVDAVNTARDGMPSDHARKALHKSLERARKCRSAIETQFPGAVVRGFSQNDVDELRVALYSAQKDWRTWPIRPKFRTGCGRCLTRSPGRSAAPCARLAPPCAMTSTRNPGTPSPAELGYSAAT